jgi:hypothetical protein
MRLRVALGVAVAGLARDHPLELFEHIHGDIGVPVLGDDQRAVVCC